MSFRFLPQSVEDFGAFAVWLLCMAAVLVLHCICDGFQSRGPMFPLSPMLWTSLVCSFVGCAYVVSCGYRAFQHKFRFYQPFSGGDSFVALQTIGYASIALSAVIDGLHATVDIPTNTYRYGLLSVSGLLQCGGGFFLMFSLSVFNASQSSGSVSGGFLRRLRRSPQREIALVSLLALANGGVAYLAGMLQSFDIALPLLAVYLLIHVVCGLVTHVVVGWQHTPNYRLFMPAAGGWKHIAAQGFSWLAFALTLEGVFLLTGALRSGGDVPLDMFVALGVVGLLANFSLLLFVRLAKRNPAPRNASFVTEHGRFVLSLVASIDGIGVLLISALPLFQHSSHLAGHMQWLPLSPTMQEAMGTCQKISALFLMVLPPLTHMIGSLAFPASFDVWQPFEGPQDFILLQAAGWAFYAASIVTGTLSLSSDTWLVAYTCSALLAQFFIHGSISAFKPSPAGSMGTKNKSSEQLGSRKSSQVFNGEMITAFLLSGSSVVLRVVCDIVVGSDTAASSYPTEVLIASATAMWAVATPLAHISGRDKGIAVFQPFSGSAEYVALQAVGWTLYAIVLILSAVSLIEGSTLSPLLCTMEGFVSLVPFSLIAMSVYCEAWHKMQDGTARPDSPRTGGLSPLKKGAVDAMLGRKPAGPPSDERAEIRRVMAATSSQWLRTMLTQALEESAPVDVHAHVRSCTPPNQQRSHDRVTPHSTPSRHGSLSTPDDLSSNALADASATDGLRERSHTIAGVTVFALGVANALLFLLSADFSLTRRTSSVILAIAGTICNAMTIAGLHCVLGPFLYGDAYKVFMPFTGGAAFVALQVLSWTSFSTECILTLLYAYELEKSSVSVFGMLIIAGILAVASQLMMLLSIWRFAPPGPHAPKTFFEAHSEGTVAVLLFLGAFGFLHTYETIAGGSAAVHPVPLLVSSASVLLAIPLGVYALRKTYRRAPHDPSLSLSSPLSPIRSPSDWNNDISATPVKSSQRQGRRGSSSSGPAAVAHTTASVSAPPLVLVEYFVLLGMGLLPLLALYIAYYYAIRGNNVVVPIFDTSRLLLPGIAVSLLLTLISRSAPQLAPQWFIDLRVVITSCTLYMIPTLIVLPSYLVPLMFPIRGTYLWAVIITLITIIPPPWNRKVMRPFVAVSLAWVMYVHGKMVMDHWREPRMGIFVEATADVALLVFWVLYIPTLRGKPEEGGTRRSKKFIQFMKTWCFDDAVNYFNMRVIADPSMKKKLADPKNKYIIAFHPHGVFPATAMYATVSDAWKNELGCNEKTYVVTHGATVLFNGPLLRDFVMALGGRSVTRSSIEASLSEGHSVIIVTGGQSELILTECSNVEMHIVTHHYGFVRLAVKNKTPLVPMLSIAENNILDLLHLYRVQRWFLKLIGFPFPLVPMGRWFLPFPHRTPLTVVVGAPIYPDPGLSPDDTEGIERLAKKYFESVKRLFYEHRVAAGYPHMELYLHHGLSPTNPKERVKREQSPPRSAPSNTVGK